MTPLTAAGTRLRLGSFGGALASAALCVFVGCSAGGANPAPGNPSSGAGTSSGGALGAGGAGASTAGSTASGGNSAGGPGGAGAAQGGSMGAGGASTLMLTMNGGKYQLAFGSTYLEIDPAYGARVTALRVGGAAGMDLIASSAVTGDPDNWGSTFWPSPQSGWLYPPTLATGIAAINSQPYSVASDATSVTFTSGTATLRTPATGAAPTLSLTKKFSADLAKEAVIIDYTLQNQGAAPVTVAPWEITRVAAGGITFYAPGSGSPMPGNFPLPPASTITTAAGAVWYQHNAADATDYKLFADGVGWLAHAAGNLLLVKSFADVPAGAAAPGEAEIEIYVSKTTKYNEVEQQGAVQTLTAKGSAGDSLHWTVRWFARTLATPAAVGSADLVAFVQNLIK